MKRATVWSRTGCDKRLLARDETMAKRPAEHWSCLPAPGATGPMASRGQDAAGRGEAHQDLSAGGRRRVEPGHREEGGGVAVDGSDVAQAVRGGESRHAVEDSARPGAEAKHFGRKGPGDRQGHAREQAGGRDALEPADDGEAPHGGRRAGGRRGAVRKPPHDRKTRPRADLPGARRFKATLPALLGGQRPRARADLGPRRLEPRRRFHYSEPSLF